MKNWARILIILALIAIVAGTVTYTAMDHGTSTQSKAPDYSQSENWLFADTEGTHEVDLFYLYPTVAKHADYPDGSSDIDDQMRKDAANIFNSTGRAFAGYTNVYAPLYRQNAMVVSEDIDPSDYDDIYQTVKNTLGHEDVINAIDYYFKHFNNGRPYILAGHSQGSCQILCILEDYMKDHPEEYSRMIAAYAVGEGVSQSYLDKNTHIKFATSASDTGVLISWNTEGPAKSGGYLKSFLIPEDCVVINPITWGRDTGYASADMNKGEYVDLGDGKYTTLAGQNDAQINADRGSITCTTIDDYIPNGVMGDVSLHMYDYKAYFKDITDNGYERVSAYIGYGPTVNSS